MLDRLGIKSSLGINREGAEAHIKSQLTTRQTGSADGWRPPRIDDARAVLLRIRVESRVWVSEDE